MFLSLLPGLRDVRVPLIVGYVFILSVWLLVYDLIPQDHAELVWDYPAIAAIGEAIGPVGIAAIASLAAYLIGGVIVRVAAAIAQISTVPVEASPNATRQRARPFGPTHDAEMDELEERIHDLVDRALEEIRDQARRDQVREEASRPFGVDQRWWRRSLGSGSASGDQVDPDIRVRVEAKSGRLDERILAEKPELYAELNRRRSEAQFRAGLLPTLTILFLAALIRLDWSLWVNVLAAVLFGSFISLLIGEMFDLRTRSRRIALRAVVDGIVTAPTLDLINLRAEQEKRRPLPAGFKT